MKKVPVFVFVLMISAVSSTHAQSFHLGIKAGTNVSKLGGRSFDEGFKFGYSVGAYAELNFTKQWGIQPELLLNQMRSHTADNFSEIYPTSGAISQVNVNVNYVNIPILLTYRPIPLLSLQFGPMFGAKVSENEIVQSSKDAFKSGDFALVGGVQFNLLKLKLGARYVGGITDIDNVGTSDTWKNKGFQLYVGLNLF